MAIEKIENTPERKANQTFFEGVKSLGDRIKDKGFLGLRGSSPEHDLIRNKDHVYDAELARQNFDGNAEQFAASREFSQMVTSMPGRDAWEKAMNLRKLAEAGGGENITNEFKRLRDANRKQQKPEAAAQPEKAKEMGLSK